MSPKKSLFSDFPSPVSLVEDPENYTAYARAAIDAKAAELNAGLPTANMAHNGSVFYRAYEKALVVWSHRHRARAVIGPIRDAYDQHNGPAGFLGTPIMDVQATSDGHGRFCDFESGSIYWHPATGAHEIHGDIQKKWLASGGATGPVGFPTSDEMIAGDGVGRFSTFERGTSGSLTPIFSGIFWHPQPHIGVRILSGEIFNVYRHIFEHLGTPGGLSWLGYPTEDQHDDTCRFQRGRILIRSNNGYRFTNIALLATCFTPAVRKQRTFPFSMDFSAIQQLENGAAQVEPTLLEGETTGCVCCIFCCRCLSGTALTSLNA